MSDTFKAILVSRDDDKKQSVDIADLTEADLMDGDVTVAVEATTVNYKDGLAITGKAPVVRRWPLVPGIDFAGTVIASENPDWQPGDRVILNGWGVGEVHHGAYAGRARVRGEWLVPLPAGMSAAEAMAVGTAGYTAMLCVLALERHGITPDKGPVVVTGAAGGVGLAGVQCAKPHHLGVSLLIEYQPLMGQQHLAQQLGILAAQARGPMMVRLFQVEQKLGQHRKENAGFAHFAVFGLRFGRGEGLYQSGCQRALQHQSGHQRPQRAQPHRYHRPHQAPSRQFQLQQGPESQAQQPDQAGPGRLQSRQQPAQPGQPGRSQGQLEGQR